MTVFAIRKFNGEIPRLPADRLPEDGAQLAVNCDFTHGELRPLRAMGPHHTVAPEARPCRAVFTHNGTNFFAWNKPTRAYLSPTIDDVYYRVYYNSEGMGFRLAQSTLMRTADNQPGPPETSFAVGVTRPVTLAQGVGGGGGAATTYTANVTVESVVNGTVVSTSSIAAGSVTEITNGYQYAVTVPAEALTNTAVGVQLTPWYGAPILTPEGLPSAEGFWVTGDAAVTVTFINTFGWSQTTSANANKWILRSDGLMYSTEWLDVGVVIASQGITPQTIVYRGVTYSNDSGNKYVPNTGAKLYDAFVQGTAGAVTQTPTLKIKVQLMDGATEVSNQYWTFVEDSDPATVNRYIVTAPAAPGGGNTTVVLTPGKVNTVVYVAVAQNLIYEQSAPSDPLVVEVPETGLSVTLSITHQPNPLELPLIGTPGGMLFYRTYPGFSSTDYFLINTTPVKPDANGTYTFTDTSTQPLTTITLATNQTSWDPPPADLSCLTYAGNGFFAGATGKDLCFSEPYKPHAWPYRMLFPHDIVGVIEIEGGLLVTTTAKPYLVFGAHPSQMTQQVLNADQAGWSNTAMARVEGVAVYANNDGVVRVAGGQASIRESQQFFTRQDWRDRYGDAKSALRLAQHDGRLLGLVDPN